VSRLAFGRARCPPGEVTVKRYGRFAAEAKEQFAWINALGQPVEVLAEARKPRLEVAR